ncbi:hypothetical protein CSA80_02790 [Candidatus Saccharibacteria bacterium]|nr:MAG: hypothetical protein CR973_02905 [Candidatus Saccharibacteria bacterium]PID99018.1 MAG: hypothetical protein CSA80_02790 [Candidatus Saccharibacteria bacterium]
MKITDIKQQIRQEGRYSIFVDGVYAFSLRAESLLAAQYAVGQTLSSAELAEAKRQAETDKAYALTLAYIARRMRSEGELLDYFRRKGYPDEFGRTVLPKLRKLGLVDDWEFARRWIDNRRMLRSSSTQRLRLELRQKKVSDDIIAALLSEGKTDDCEMLRMLIAKKRKQTRYQDDQKLIAYLARQGFSYGDIKAVMAVD